MTNLERLKKSINQHKGLLKEKYQVVSLNLFGSYLREEETPESDIDLLVEFNKTIDLFRFIALENFLSGICGRKVDLVMKNSLKPRIKDSVLREAVQI